MWIELRVLHGDKEPDRMVLITYAVYRLFYGRDWILESIDRVIDHVDRVFVFFVGPFEGWGSEWAPGEKFPRDPDGAKQQVREKYGRHPKVSVIESDWNHQKGQFSHFVNDVILPWFPHPDAIVINEFDHLWVDFVAALKEWRDRRNKNVLRWMKVTQTELWRPPHVDEWYKVPDRPQRTGPIFWDMREGEIPQTIWHGHTGHQPDNPVKSGGVLNVGYAVCEETMLWKIRCAIAHKSDSRVDPNYLEDVYMAWKPNMQNLEISINHRSAIPRVYKWRGRI